MCAICIGVGQVIGQQPVFRHLTVEDGLPSSWIYSITEDQQGYVWITSREGVARYDGYRFRHFTTSSGLPGNEVLYAYCDKKGKIWMRAFKQPLSYYDPVTARMVIMDSIRSIRRVDLDNIIAEDKRGVMWLSLHRNGIARIDSGRISYLAIPMREELRGLSSETDILFTERLFVGPEGNVWFFSAHGLHQMLPEGPRFFRFPENQLFYSSIGTATPDGAIIYGSRRRVKKHYHSVSEHNLYMLRDGRHELWIPGADYTLQDGRQPLRNSLIIQLLVDAGGHLWVGTTNGLLYIDLKKGPASGKWFLDGQFVTAIAEDREGNLWVGTQRNGVYFLSYNARHVTTYRPGDKPRDRQMYRLLQAPDGQLRIIRDRTRLSRFDAGRFHDVDLPSTRTSDYIRTMAFDARGRLWLGFDQQGFGILTGDNFEHFDVPGSVKSIAVTAEGPIFACHTAKVLALPADFLRLTAGMGREERALALDALMLQVGRFYALLPVPDGGLWMGNPNGLYYRHPNGRLDTLARQDSLLAADIAEIVPGPGAQLLLATRGAGVLVYDTLSQAVTAITLRDGLSGDIGSRIVCDGDSTLWFATNTGLNRIRRKGADWATAEIAAFTARDGLGANEINDILLDGDTMYVATMQGLSVFDKRELHPSGIPPVVHLIDVKVNGKSRPLDAVYELSYQENLVSLTFTGIAFKSADALRFRYHLAGAEGGWQESKDRTVQFVNLAPGTYRFEVLAVNDAGIESVEPATVAIRIRPPFWKAWWFRGLLLVLLIAGIYLFFRIRVLTYNRDVVRDLLQITRKRVGGKSWLTINHTDGTKLRLDAETICWLQADGNYVDIVTTDRKYTERITLKKMAAQLPLRNDFLRVHKSYIVRLDKVERVDKKGTFLMIAGQQIPIGRTYRDKVRQRLDKLF